MKTTFRALLAVIAVALLLAAASAYANEPSFTTVTAQQLKAEMDKGKKLLVVDSRSQDEFAQGHIPGAINIPPEVFQYIAGYLPKDKGYPIVFYCRGFS